MILNYIFHICSWNLQQLLSVFLYNVHVCSFVGPSHNVHQHANRIKVHLIRLLHMNYFNTNIISFHHFKSLIAKGVPRMIVSSPVLQHWIHNHTLPVSCDWVHHKRSLNRTKVVLISKACVVTHTWPLDNIKIESKKIKVTFKW